MMVFSDGLNKAETHETAVALFPDMQLGPGLVRRDIRPTQGILLSVSLGQDLELGTS